MSEFSNLFNVDDHMGKGPLELGGDSKKLLMIQVSPNPQQQYRLMEQQKRTNASLERTNNIALNYIWPTFPIGFLVLGTIANLLSIIVFRRKEMKRFSSFCYFFYLNVVNMAVLYVTLSRVIMEFNFNVDIRRLNLLSCKLHVFLTYFLGHLSSMLLCSISIDRVISVLFLHRAKILCTPRVAMRVAIGLVLFNFILSSHFLIFESGYVKNEIRILKNSRTNLTGTSTIDQLVYIEKVVYCDPIPKTLYDKLVQEVWKIIDMSIYAFIPFTIMLICSFIIIIRVAQQSKKFRANKKKTVATTNQSPMLKANRAECEKRISRDAESTTQHAKLSIQPVTAKSNEARMSTRTRNLALMLIPVNFLFLAFLAPVVIAMYTYKNLSQDLLTLVIVELLSYCNFTLNFFIYFITSSKFREEFFKFVNESLLKRKLVSNGVMHSTVANNNHTVTTSLRSKLLTKNGATKATPVETKRV